MVDNYASNFEADPKIPISSRYSFLKWLIPGLLFFAVLLYFLYAIFKPLSQESVSIPDDPASEEILVKCPVPQEFCDKSTVLILALPENKQKKEGLGWTLPKDTQIRAAFDGTFKQRVFLDSTPAASIATVTSPLGRYEARYIFLMEGSDPKKYYSKEKEVKVGEILTTISSVSLKQPGFDGANLQFYIIDFINRGKMVLLNPEDIENEIVLPKE